MSWLRQRRREPEVMDQPDLDPGRHARALAGLARINFFSRSSGILFGPLRQLQQRLGAPHLRVLDVASGGGDVAVRLWRRAARAGLDWRIAGCDISPVAVALARAAALRARAPVHFFEHDVLTAPLRQGFDAVVSSLFLHHLDEPSAAGLLGAMARAGGSLVLVNDLDRSLHGLVLAHLAVRLLSSSPVVHVDGPRSVAAAFTPAEALALADRAGLHGARVRRRWPCRWLLSWSRPS
jgi:SAM-dependent methyltransferase